ncbi:MAG: phosphoglucomutase/phosphomannomutase PgmG [Pseudomonadota bacterium]
MTAAHEFDPSVLREYDIRGIVGRTLSGADARAVGRGFGTRVIRAGGRRAALGWDGRPSSPELAAALAEGLAAAGVEVLRIGLGPSPMLYYAVHALALDGGVMVTGSHNPPEYNGFKMMLGQASFWGRDIQALGAAAAAGDFAAGAGRIADRAVFADYVGRLGEAFRGGRALSVAWDAGNGAAGPAMAALAARLPGRHIVLNESVDGRFPAHHPDPSVPENLAQLQAAVSEGRADLGIAFDGDGDRIGVVDGEARILWGDQLLAILARDVLAERPGATIIADVKASQVLFDEIARLGGRPLMWRTGHSLIKTKMAETGAPLAGEMSGHIFFADRWYGFDDALYAAVRLLSVLARTGDSLAALRDRLPKAVNTPELRIPCPETRKFAAIEEVKARLTAAGAEFCDIDGARVRTADGWWLLRASNTQDALVARCEAREEAGLVRLKAELMRQLRLSGVSPPRL